VNWGRLNACNPPFQDALASVATRSAPLQLRNWADYVTVPRSPPTLRDSLTRSASVLRRIGIAPTPKSLDALHPLHFAFHPSVDRVTSNFRELLSYLQTKQPETFSVAGRLDERRYLPRKFPRDLPLLLSLQSYPAYRRMVGENWMHWHDYYELWVATEGSGEYRCGNHQFAFTRGDVVIVDPLKIHGVLRMERGHAPLVILFPIDAVAPTGSDVDLGFLAAWDRRADRMVPRLAATSPVATAVHGAILRLAQAWYENHQTDGRIQALKFHLLETLMHLRHAFIDETETSRTTQSMRAEREARLSRVLEYVGQHCNGRLSQPEVARIAGMSTSRFRAFFKATTGWGFGDYLRELRLERAAVLLRETSESVAAIAYQTGFADQSHLQRLFKARYTASPLSYRKRHQV
jgi:AraC-like DNA-binding protein/mannose-6-phosphate isomerase-like protein (cupin superfamily)